jgi:hypothetical protein
MLQNKKLLYGLLFRASATTLLEIAADPKHLGAEIGFFSVLHTWGQNLMHHPHVHCVIPTGGLSQDHKEWINPRYRFFLPRGVLASVFRGKFVDGLKQAFRQGKLRLTGELKSLTDEKVFGEFLRTAHRHKWVVEVKPPFGGPEYVLKYLAHYTHRVAISNHRLVSLSDGKVTFRWKDYRDGSKSKLMILTVNEFLRRFLLHTLPRGFVRIRFFGFMANRRRAGLLPICRSLTATKPQQSSLPPEESCDKAAWTCPLCGGPMTVVQRMTAEQIFRECMNRRADVDSS